jgi:hypothetical protein
MYKPAQQGGQGPQGLEYTLMRRLKREHSKEEYTLMPPIDEEPLDGSRRARLAPAGRRSLGRAAAAELGWWSCALAALVLAYALLANRGMLVRMLALGYAPMDLPWSSTPRLDDPDARDSLTVVAIVRDESAYAEEWVAHHYRLGVRRFRIYDNTRPGESEPLTRTLRDWILLGVVVVVPAADWSAYAYVAATGLALPLPATPLLAHLVDALIQARILANWQVRAYVHAWRAIVDAEAAAARHEWLAVLDMDEFHNPSPQSGTIDLRARLRAARLRGARAVRIGLHIFGPGGHRAAPPRSQGVRRAFLWRGTAGAEPVRNGSEAARHRRPTEHRAQLRFKAIVLAAGALGTGGGCVHGFDVAPILAELLAGRGAVCNRWPHDRWPGDALVGRALYPRQSDWSVHHYETKSVAECARRAFGTGNMGPVKGEPSRKCAIGFMSWLRDDSMLAHVRNGTT